MTSTAQIIAELQVQANALVAKLNTLALLVTPAPVPVTPAPVPVTPAPVAKGGRKPRTKKH